MAFIDDIRDDAEEVWVAILEHPMVQQLGDVTPDEDPFSYRVKQDYVYLIEYSRVFGLGAAKAPKLSWTSTFAGLLESTVNVEMDLHRSYAESFG